ncbi:putative ATP-dependent RNA helicase TDRD12 isoform X2 [Lissotriton helveticus]
MSELEVLKIENPGCFWGIIRRGFGAIPENAEEYERLYIELNRLYSVTYRDTEEIKPSALEKGQVCAVFSEELKCWCRATIESFMSSGDDFLAECFLVDYAKYIPVKTRSIRAAVESCWQLPYRAKEFQLHHLHPMTLHIDLTKDTAELGPGKRWDSAAIQHFHNLLKESKHTEVKLCTMEGNKYSVYLYVTIQDVTVCVNDDLVAKNFAQFAHLVPLQENHEVKNCKNRKSIQLDFSNMVALHEKNEVYLEDNPASNLWPVLFQELEKKHLEYIFQEQLEKQQGRVFSANGRLTRNSESKDWPADKMPPRKNEDIKHGCANGLSADEMLTWSADMKDWFEDKTPTRKNEDIKRDCAKLLQILNPDSLKPDDDDNIDQLQKPPSQPIVLRKLIQPCSTLEVAPLSAELKRELIRNQFCGPNFTESYCWPSIVHGCDTLVISPQGRNPMNYVPPVLTYLHISSAACKTLPSRNGPLVLIICHGWKKAQYVFEVVEMYGRCIKPLNPMLILTGLNKEEAKNVTLRRGCDVIVSTPDSVLRLLLHHSLLFLRICHLVFDEVDILFTEANDQMFKILEVYNKAIHAEDHENAPQQIVAVGTRWMKALDDVARDYMTDPHVVITSMEEAAFYGNVQQVVQLCLDCEKISALQRTLDFTPTIVNKVLIFTNSVDEAEVAFKAVESSSIFCLKIHENLTFLYNQVVEHWNKLYTCGTHVVLVLTDGFLPSLHISDATCVIHFGFPTSQRIFGMRMLSMLDNFRNRFDKDASLEQECSNAKSILLMSEKNAVHAVGILRYLEHTEAAIPPELFDFTAGILSAKEEMKHGRPFCQLLKAFGVCKESSTCPFRHNFNAELDLPRKIGDGTLPAEGIISMLPLFIVDATCYFARIVFKEDPYLSLAKEISDFYAVSNNRIPVGNVEKSALYGVQDGLHYHRVEVLETIQKEENCISCMVNYIDEGKQGEVQNHNLLQLPTKFHSLPPQAIEFIVCRVKPIDNEIQWNPKVTRHINRKIKGKLHEAKVVFCMGNTVFVDPMVHVVKLVDLKTSLNEYNVRSEILSTGMGVDNPEHLKKLKNLCREAQVAASNKRSSPEVDHSSTSSGFHSNSSSLQDCLAVSEICNSTQMVQNEKHDKLNVILEPKTVLGTSTLTPISEPKSLHPEVKWFQKEDTLTLAIKIRNLAYHNCTFSSNRVVFSALAGDKYYLADLELDGEILTDKSFCLIKNEEPVIILSKANIGAWNSLLKLKKPNVSFDFDHWEYHENSDRFPVALSCAPKIYTADHEEGDSSEKSESESD